MGRKSLHHQRALGQALCGEGPQKNEQLSNSVEEVTRKSQRDQLTENEITLFAQRKECRPGAFYYVVAGGGRVRVQHCKVRKKGLKEEKASTHRTKKERAGGHNGGRSYVVSEPSARGKVRGGVNHSGGICKRKKGAGEDGAEKHAGGGAEAYHLGRLKGIQKKNGIATKKLVGNGG